MSTTFLLDSDNNLTIYKNYIQKIKAITNKNSKYNNNNNNNNNNIINNNDSNNKIMVIIIITMKIMNNKTMYMKCNKPSCELSNKQ